MENDPKQHVPFTDEERANILEYGAVLRDINSRLVKEGYFLDGGRKMDICKVVTFICRKVWKDYKININSV